ncbi:hypothetical protein PHLCEN_2v506 [Hermanssonia centrifuga]|uniref:Uncharacterized protein n=1 Tax=Hermanssonia centrifuga TaxID=98765 RepID=A0A2R6S5Z1_9APHY|nr:hypothetical protein PHLCEN_2v506 [Hermanssonia centrifuga]
MSSPLTPLHSPRPATVSPRTNLHSPSDTHADRRPSGLPDLLQDEQLLARYSLRTRKAKQVNPYEYDKMLYKRQMRANPDAIVKVVSPPQRKHRERSGEQMRDSDADVDPQDLDLDRSDDDRPVRQRSKSAGIKAAEAHHLPPGPGDRSSMYSGGNSWYPSAFNDSSSSEEGEIVPVTRNAPPGRERQPKRRRKRRFPMAREVPQAGPHRSKVREAIFYVIAARTKQCLL